MRTTFTRLAVLIAVLLAGLAVGAGPASADPAPLAAVSCTRAAQFVSGGYQANYVPVTSSGSTNCVLAKGNNSTAVWGLQMNLNICYQRSLTTDGDFGQLTKNALIYAQGKMVTGADGVYGPDTRKKMKMYYTLSGTTPLCVVFGSRTWTFDHFQS
ncbi:peptidoglycan-binding domain-containing protein [Actinoplanes sp. Pm04-4]|uniref:Peptidoglycan-binding domain-containing protein n=1 Tax=Paractinoplanes pyxinae TaxID=2997416 RepID=A0ABT4AX86_9ACTN|nr:peptidoglycan-binding domain-containing protein [Actinoplanes pyxinae]MCY1138280.1 peptidoglycan-binding domain-containing protein [Actinoplanes pyxinae]